jgi:hypothetical protein
MRNVGGLKFMSNGIAIAQVLDFLHALKTNQRSLLAYLVLRKATALVGLASQRFVVKKSC